DCEDYGQAVKYLGSSDNQKLFFTLDQGHIFQKGKIELVCGNTYRMLQQSRFSKHFEFYGSWDTHFGIFDCGPNKSTNLEMTTENISSGCC
ncbi:MAG: hypothetical protein KDD50_10065, partial [Bdellovibrionales bacterium]|nr:hypothetical protein [Bdellovibrionales bacterium]